MIFKRELLVFVGSEEIVPGNAGLAANCAQR